MPYLFPPPFENAVFFFLDLIGVIWASQAHFETFELDFLPEDLFSPQVLYSID
jgi:hypothetical protein